jgi:hypothetical protein
MKCMFCGIEMREDNTGSGSCFLHGNSLVISQDGPYTSRTDIYCNYSSEEYRGYHAVLMTDRWLFYRHLEFLFERPYIHGQITPENVEQKIKMLLSFV